MEEQEFEEEGHVDNNFDFEQEMNSPAK